MGSGTWSGCGKGVPGGAGAHAGGPCTCRDMLDVRWGWVPEGSMTLQVSHPRGVIALAERQQHLTTVRKPFTRADSRGRQHPMAKGRGLPVIFTAPAASVFPI